MSVPTKPNSERIMLVLFPLITLGLFVVGIVIWWVTQNWQLWLPA